MLFYAFLEFPDSNTGEGHTSYLARQYNMFLHGGFSSPEWEARGIHPERFRYSWWSRYHGTTLNIGLEMNPETLPHEIARLKEMFQAVRVQIFMPEYGIPVGAEIPHAKRSAEVVGIEDFRQRSIA